MPGSAARFAAAVPADVLEAPPGQPVNSPGDRSVAGVCDDTRRVRPGDLFIARGDDAETALSRLTQATAAGATAAIVPSVVEEAAARQAAGPGVALFRAAAGTSLDQAAAGRVADAFFDHPAAGLTLVGVTGTNGKTTVATLTAHLLRAAGVRTGLLGTVSVDTGSGARPATLTTPGAVELRSLLAEMRDHGCRAAVMEVSSHALDQGRVSGLAFDVAVFTNLTQDHLDYHGSMEAYAAAKARLFGQLRPDGAAIGNADDPAWAQLSTHLAGRARIDTSVVDGRSVTPAPERATDASPAPAAPGVGRATARVSDLQAISARACFTGPFGRFEAILGTGGLHNVSNALQAVAAADEARRRTPRPPAPREARQPGGHVGEPWATALRNAPPVAGRLEPVAAPPGTSPGTLPAVLVDYAHTPDALERVLSALRPVTTGRLICVYGCGGDRDRTKRPRMTRAALRGADLAVLTSDNPRTEDPCRILDDASAEVDPVDAPRLRREIDRRAAIVSAIAAAGPADTVIIAGKGHEDYQLVGDGAGGIRRLPFDDREEAGVALAAPRG